MEVTKNNILNGFINLYQPKKGFRVGIDSILLASSISSCDNCLEFGTGTGIISLSLAKRFPLSHIMAIEKNKELIKIGKKNIILNNLKDLNIKMIYGDLRKDSFLADLNNTFDRVVMNPPYFNKEKFLLSLNKTKMDSKYEDNIYLWFSEAYKKLKPKGYLNFIYRSECLDMIMQYLNKDWGDIRIFPLWPKKGLPSKLIIVQAKKKSKSEVKLLSGLVLHNDDGTYTEACNSILMNTSNIDLNKY